MSSPPHAVRDELSALARLAAPVVLVQVGMMMMGTVDAMMVGHFSSEGLAAVALGNVFHWGIVVFVQGILMSLDPLVSQAWGAGDHDAVSRWFQRGLVMAAVLSVPVVLLFWNAEPVLLLLRQPASSVPLAAGWIRAVSWGVPPLLAFFCMRQTLQAIHVVRPVLIVVVVANVANLVGNWALVYGHLGAPAMGTVGSGISTAICRWLMALLLALGTAPALAEVWRGRRTDENAPSLWTLPPYLRMLALGVPTGLQIGLEVWVFMTVSVLMGWLGSSIQAAHQIAMNLASLAFMVPLGIGAAAAVRVGNAIGRGDPEGSRRSALVALGAGASVMTVSALAFGLLPGLLASAYTEDPELIRLAKLLLPIAALFQIFDGTQAVGSGILRGAADTRAAAVINFVVYWAIGLPVGLLLAFRLGMGPRGLWWGLTLGLALAAVLLVHRVVRRIGRDASAQVRVA